MSLLSGTKNADPYMHFHRSSPYGTKAIELLNQEPKNEKGATRSFSTEF